MTKRTSELFVIGWKTISTENEWVEKLIIPHKEYKILSIGMFSNIICQIIFVFCLFKCFNSFFLFSFVIICFGYIQYKIHSWKIPEEYFSIKY